MPEVEVVVRLFVFPSEVLPDVSAEQVASDLVLKGLDSLGGVEVTHVSVTES